MKPAGCGCGCGSYIHTFSFPPNRKYTHPGISRAWRFVGFRIDLMEGGGLQRWLILLPPHSLVLSCQPSLPACFLCSTPLHLIHSFDTFSSSSSSSYSSPSPPPFYSFLRLATTTTLILIIPATMDRALDDVVRERSVGSFFCVLAAASKQSTNAPEARKQ